MWWCIIRQWLTIDNECPVFEHTSDEEIINNVSGALSDNADVDANEADDAHEVIEPPPKVTEAIQELECALSWLETEEVDYVKVLHIRNMLDFARSKRETGMRQLNLDQFFQRN